jgi:hypothetical protein
MMMEQSNQSVEAMEPVGQSSQPFVLLQESNESNEPIEPIRSKHLTQLAWTEPELGNLDDFATKNRLYPACIVTIYQIVRDLHIKQELIEITIIDGSKWQRNEYFIQARVRTSTNLRLMIPYYLDADIDLPW